MDNSILTARGLKKHFGPRYALDGLDLDIIEGETYGLIGPNGAGKTTFIRIAIGLSKPSEGEITVLGKHMPDRSITPSIGYMTQKGALYLDLTVMENLKFFGALYGLSGPDGRKRIEEVLDVVELGNRCNDIVGNMSGGMIQRASLAVALLHRPKLLFLDEPTAGVDPELRLNFWDHFERLNAEGATIIVSTHHLDEASRCKRLGMLREGKLIAQGTPDELRNEASTDNLEEAFLKFAKERRGIAQSKTRMGYAPTGNSGNG